MKQIKATLKEQLAALYEEGTNVYMGECERQKGATKHEPKPKKMAVEPVVKKQDLRFAYQAWYSKALPVVRQLLPERYQEFQDQYKLSKRKDENLNLLTYTISDYLIGILIPFGFLQENAVEPFSAFSSKFQHQLSIFASANERIDSLLADIEGVLQTELFSHELEAAADLLKKKHLRAAGALAGVSLEVHLGRVSNNHGVSIGKKAPTIADLNEALKAASILDLPTWRLVQRLGDIRNLCVHAKERDPTVDEVTDLLAGTRKILATVF